MEKEDPGLIRVIALEDCAFPRKGSHRFERVKTKRQLPYQSGKDQLGMNIKRGERNGGEAEAEVRFLFTGRASLRAPYPSRINLQ